MDSNAMSIQCTPDLIMMTDELELQGVPKKGDPRLNGYKGHQKLTRDKSRVSFKQALRKPWELLRPEGSQKLS